MEQSSIEIVENDGDEQTVCNMCYNDNIDNLINIDTEIS